MDRMTSLAARMAAASGLGRTRTTARMRQSVDQQPRTRYLQHASETPRCLLLAALPAIRNAGRQR